MARLTLRIDLGDGRALGPGKARLLELVRETGSISAAGRAMGMSYRRAWLLVDALNHIFCVPLVEAKGGGAGGGGATLTPFGGSVVDAYRAMERDAHSVSAQRLGELEAALAGAPERHRVKPAPTRPPPDQAPAAPEPRDARSPDR